MTSDLSDLKIAVEQPRTWARRLTVTVPAERVERERQETLKKLAQRVRLPGFRPGKVTPQEINRRFGHAVEHETVERVVGEAYREAIQREGLQPITQGAVENVDYSPGSDLTFNVEFEVRPEIELSRLGGFKVERPPAEVARDEPERVLERLREEHAVWHAVEDAAPGAGELVSVEITPLTAEAAGEPRPYEFVLGQGHAVQDVEDAIRTLRPGEEGEFVVRIADDEPTEEGAPPHEQGVRIRLQGIKRPELPALDDDFARSLGDFDGLTALRKRVQEDLEREALAEAERSVRNQLLERILEANSFELPDSMVNQYVDRIIRPREGADPDRLAETRQIARPAAEHALRRMLVIERVAEAHGLHASQDDVDQRVEQVAERNGRPVGEVWAQLQKSGRLRAIEDEITEERVFEFLKAQSTIA